MTPKFTIFSLKMMSKPEIFFALLNLSKSAMLMFDSKNMKNTLKHSFDVEIDGQQVLRYRYQVSKYIQKVYAALRYIHPHKEQVDSSFSI